MRKPTLGFKEWTKYSVNCVSGCSNNCRYCYAKGMAVRFGRMEPGEWPSEVIREKDVNKKRKQYDGRVMFPSSHDITPTNLDACVTVIGNLLQVGNELLIVSKPRIPCIELICKKFQEYKQKVLFRFTIGTMNNRILGFWEPNAPSYEERRDCLQLAYESGFGTSVSIEPMLEPMSVVPLVEDLEPYITDAIWIGKMNHIRKSIRMGGDNAMEAFTEIEAGQSDKRIFEIYDRLKDNPLIKWKESIKSIIGLDGPDDHGIDK